MLTSSVRRPPRCSATWARDPLAAHRRRSGRRPRGRAGRAATRRARAAAPRDERPGPARRPARGPGALRCLADPARGAGDRRHDRACSSHRKTYSKSAHVRTICPTRHTALFADGRNPRTARRTAAHRRPLGLRGPGGGDLARGGLLRDALERRARLLGRRESARPGRCWRSSATSTRSASSSPTSTRRASSTSARSAAGTPRSWSASGSRSAAGRPGARASSAASRSTCSTPDQRKKVVELKGLHIDIGAADRDEARRAGPGRRPGGDRRRAGAARRRPADLTLDGQPARRLRRARGAAPLPRARLAERQLRRGRRGPGGDRALRRPHRRLRGAARPGDRRRRHPRHRRSRASTRRRSAATRSAPAR